MEICPWCLNSPGRVCLGAGINPNREPGERHAGGWRICLWVGYGRMGLVKVPQFNFSDIPESFFGLLFGPLATPKQTWCLTKHNLRNIQVDMFYTRSCNLTGNSDQLYYTNENWGNVSMPSRQKLERTHVTWWGWMYFNFKFIIQVSMRDVPSVFGNLMAHVHPPKHPRRRKDKYEPGIFLYWAETCIRGSNKTLA